MNTCAYCLQARKLTKEHVLSDTVLKAFPDAPMTFDERRGIVHGGDPLVKDLCEACNSGLTDSDNEAGRVARAYLQQVIPLGTRLTWDANLMRLWVFKTAANCDRSATGGGRGWWKEYRESLRQKVDIPGEVIVLFGAWKPIGPLASMLEIPRPIQAEEAIVYSAHLPKDEVQKVLKAAWSIKVGYGVFLILIFTDDQVARRIVLGDLKKQGWLTVGEDDFVAHRPFNVITAQKPSIVIDPRDHSLYEEFGRTSQLMLDMHAGEVE